MINKTKQQSTLNKSPMKKTALIFILNFAFCISHFVSAQTLNPTVIPASGGYSTGGGKSLSWTLGETSYKTLQNGSFLLTQGFQQPYITLRILNLKAFLEGLYVSGGSLTALLYNNSLSADPTASDSVLVELRDSSLPDNVVASSFGILHTDGTAVILFPSSLMNGAYYLVIRHRNSMETWSKNPVMFNSSVTNFDFTTP